MDIPLRVGAPGAERHHPAPVDDSIQGQRDEAGDVVMPPGEIEMDVYRALNAGDEVEFDPHAGCSGAWVAPVRFSQVESPGAARVLCDLQQGITNRRLNADQQTFMQVQYRAEP
jgi:cold shock CspA family protein